MEQSEAEMTFEEEGKIHGEQSVKIAGDGDFSMIEEAKESGEGPAANPQRRSAVVRKRTAEESNG